MKVGIIGSGIVGQATGMGLVANGHQARFYDIDNRPLQTLREKGYETTDEIEDVIDHAEAIFVCVPTPTVNKKINLKIIESCAISIGKSLRNTNKYLVITFRSTIPPQTTRTKLIPLLEAASGLRSGEDFGVCMNPEFLREKSPLQDFLEPNRIVVGALDKRSGDKLRNIYSNFTCPLIVTDLDTAEMIKYSSNTFLAAKISFFNEIYLICRKLGIDEKVVSDAVALDPRIGKYGVFGGTPFGGMCLPKDLQAFIHFAGTKGINPVLLKAIAKVNQQIVQFCPESPRITSEATTIPLEMQTTCS